MYTLLVNLHFMEEKIKEDFSQHKQFTHLKAVLLRMHISHECERTKVTFVNHETERTNHSHVYALSYLVLPSRSSFRFKSI